ncbi:ArnT family glycosyltransferase [Flagellimonas pacifica]|uniref:Dolichyl-phosphate-mannose-protein mannosyltransferase n=1 Tax=Flagellimonas pacifica TaxID=1247520 RepID=A0A285ME09_9FLAO|nr:glycosyltransferase family 39 protein [Allomuricauda parva]SNY94697.1 Dolichyl-phosphate-mannose-protein mannosyltransferase [Allomuricauda parva]
MLKKANLYLTFNYQALDWKTVFLILFLIAFFIRFPFFFRDYIDRDESTFIIMGQSWADGYLPYTQLWDLKPPITFLFFALVIKIFGKSFIAIRFFGTLLVVITSLFTYGIAKRIVSKKVGFWSAIFCVFFLSMFGSLQGVMSEHICTLFFVMGVYLLLFKESMGWFFVVGILFGLSVMSKLNMAYPLLTLMAYWVWKAVTEKRFWHSFQQLGILGIGFLVLIVLTATPYYLQGEIQIWWGSIFEAPLAYAGSKQHSIVKTLPFVFVVAILLYIGFASKVIDFKSKPIQILTIVIVGVLFSFMQTGKVNGHYLIQLYPFILIPAGVAVSKLPPIKKKYNILIASLLILLPMEAYLEYTNVISNKMEKGSFYNGEGVDIPNYIIENNVDTKNIFFTEYHIGYWVLGKNPPTKAVTHPYNIQREELFPFMQNARKTGIQELQYIMDVIKPKTIIVREAERIYDEELPEFNFYMNLCLARHYTLTKTIGRGLIYQRLEGQ